MGFVYVETLIAGYLTALRLAAILTQLGALFADGNNLNLLRCLPHHPRLRQVGGKIRRPCSHSYNAQKHSCRAGCCPELLCRWMQRGRADQGSFVIGMGLHVVTNELERCSHHFCVRLLSVEAGARWTQMELEEPWAKL